MGDLNSLTDEKCIDFLVKLYNKYKHESWILSHNQCLEKSNSWFGNEKFKLRDVTDALKRKCLNRSSGDYENTFLFGLKSGVFFGRFGFMSDKTEVLEVSEIPKGKNFPHTKKSSIQSYFTSNDFKENRKEDVFKWIVEAKCVITLTNPELTFLKELKKNLLNESDIIENLNEKEEENRVKSLESKWLSLLQELDKDGNGKIDVIEGNDFDLLLKKHQKKIIELGRNDNKNYVQQFIQQKRYLDTQKENIQLVFDSIKDIPDPKLLDEYVKVLKNKIHSYEILLINSLNMICVLIEDDLLTFYDIYESLDKLNIFNSNYQNEMLTRLSNIEGKLEGILDSIDDMSRSIVSGLNSLTKEVSHSTKLLSKNLKSIKSGIDINTVVTGIGAYQMYKIKTKSLN